VFPDRTLSRRLAEGATEFRFSRAPGSTELTLPWNFD